MNSGRHSNRCGAALFQLRASLCSPSSAWPTVALLLPRSPRGCWDDRHHHAYLPADSLDDWWSSSEQWTLHVRNVFTVSTRLTWRVSFITQFPYSFPRRKEFLPASWSPDSRLLQRSPWGCRWVPGRTMAGSRPGAATFSAETGGCCS